jgi:hypothetical protein
MYPPLHPSSAIPAGRIAISNQNQGNLEKEIKWDEQEGRRMNLCKKSKSQGATLTALITVTSSLSSMTISSSLTSSFRVRVLGFGLQQVCNNLWVYRYIKLTESTSRVHGTKERTKILPEATKRVALHFNNLPTTHGG